MPSEQHLPYRSTADVVVLDGDGSRWVRETNGTCPDENRTCPDNVPFSPKNGASSHIAGRSTELARRLMVHELRYAATGAYRHVYALDVIAGAIGVDAEGKYEHDIEREVYARLADIIGGSVNAPTGPRKRTMKVGAYLVEDFSGDYGSAWAIPVTAFTDRNRAFVCKRKRELRSARLNGGDLHINDYLGSCVRRIEVVIDE